MKADLETVTGIFARMQEDGLDPNKPLKWGFFFIDRAKNNLQKVISELGGHGYVTESMHQTDDGYWVLQVSKTDTLTPEKLHKRNIAFNELSEYCGVELYDGWDVGKPED